jgi:hypothetical protein
MMNAILEEEGQFGSRIDVMRKNWTDSSQEITSLLITPMCMTVPTE